MNTFHTRNHRYRISVHYVDDRVNRFGNTEPTIVTFDMVDLLLKSLNPIKWPDWISTVKTLGRGGYVNITNEQVEGQYRILKLIRIERN